MYGKHSVVLERKSSLLKTNVKNKQRKMATQKDTCRLYVPKKYRINLYICFECVFSCMRVAGAQPNLLCSQHSRLTVKLQTSGHPDLLPRVTQPSSRAWYGRSKIAGGLGRGIWWLREEGGGGLQRRPPATRLLLVSRLYLACWATCFFVHVQWSRLLTVIVCAIVLQ